MRLIEVRGKAEFLMPSRSREAGRRCGDPPPGAAGPAGRGVHRTGRVVRLTDDGIREKDAERRYVRFSLSTSPFPCPRRPGLATGRPFLVPA
jgi:hypothetical protein